VIDGDWLCMPAVHRSRIIGVNATALDGSGVFGGVRGADAVIPQVTKEAFRAVRSPMRSPS